MKRTREELLERAKSIFSEKGYHRASVSDIVSSMGIARGTFYLYFRNKDHIYGSILKRLVSEISSRLKVIDTEGDPFLQLKENLRSVFELVIGDRDLARIIIYHSYRENDSFDTILEEFFKDVKSLIRSALLTGMRMGFIRRCDVDVVSSVIMGGLLQIVKDIVNGEVGEEDVDRVIDELIALTMKGLVR